MMDQIFSYLKKNILIIGIVFCIGAYTGYKVLESIGMAALMANIPIPEGSIADKDVFIKNLPEGKMLEPKELVSVDRKAKNIILLIADGMSISQVSSYRLIKGGPNERLAVDDLWTDEEYQNLKNDAIGLWYAQSENHLCDKITQTLGYLITHIESTTKTLHPLTSYL